MSAASNKKIASFANGQSIDSEGTAMEARFSATFAEILYNAKSNLIFTVPSQDALGVITSNGKGVNTSYIQLEKPTAVTAFGNSLHVATADSIITYLRHSGQVAGEGSHYDAIYLAQSMVFTGAVDIQDIAVGSANNNQGIWFISTAFSALCRLSPEYSFVPMWRPKWVTELAHERRSYLSGLAFVEGAPKYATSYSQTDSLEGWKEQFAEGVLVDIATNRLIATGLSLPNSPRWYRGDLYFLEAGRGALSKIDTKSGAVNKIATVPGVAKGLEFIGPYALVGVSSDVSDIPSGYPILDAIDSLNCGVIAIDLRTGTLAGSLTFQAQIKQINDIALISDVSNVMIAARTAQTSKAFVLPKSALRDVKRT